MTSQAKLQELDAIRKEVGLLIDPKTAELHWTWGQIADPYGDFGAELPDECYCIGRVYFARSPSSDSIWVEFGDLPDATRNALWERMKQPISPEPRWGSKEDYFFNAARVLKAGSDEDYLSNIASDLTETELTMATSLYEAWLGGMKHWASVAELERPSPFHLELEARRSRAALCLTGRSANSGPLCPPDANPASCLSPTKEGRPMCASKSTRCLEETFAGSLVKWADAQNNRDFLPYDDHTVV